LIKEKLNNDEGEKDELGGEVNAILSWFFLRILTRKQNPVLYLLYWSFIEVEFDNFKR
jgi:hypothetical protein